VLKAPSHLSQLRTLFAVYPDARVVLIHRDPLKTVPSTISLMGTLKSMRSGHADVDSLAHFVPLGYGMMLDDAIDARANGELPDERFVDVRYGDLMGSPVATLEGVYEQLGLPWPVAMGAAVEGHLARRPKDARGAHHRQCRDLGVAGGDRGRCPRLAALVDPRGGLRRARWRGHGGDGRRARRGPCGRCHRRAARDPARALERRSGPRADGLHERLHERGWADVRESYGFVLLATRGAPTTTTDLAALLGVSKQATSKLLEAMEVSGYVRRTADPIDARVKVVELADRGHELLAVVEQVYAELEAEWAATIGSAAVEQVRAGLLGVLLAGNEGTLPAVRP